MNRVSWVIPLALLLCAPSTAKEVAGIQVPETITLQDTPLVLNGAGTRTRFFVKVYVGALYLPFRQTAAEGVFAAPGPKSVRLQMQREVAGEQMNEALNDGFAANHTEAELEALRPRIEQFRAMIPTVRRGDTVRLDFLDGGATEVWINDTQRGAVTGADFQTAVLKIWLGEKPADRSLKQAMLGQ